MVCVHISFILSSIHLFVCVSVHCTDNTMQVLLKQLELKRNGQFITPKMLHLILNYLKQAYVLCVHAHVYICNCVCLCVCLCVCCVCTCRCVSVCVHICVYVYMYMYVYVCVHACVYTCACNCMCTFVCNKYVYTYVCLCTWVHM